MKQAILLFLIAVLCAGCGSNFEWFPKNEPFQNNSTAAPTPTPTPAPSIAKSISFPTGVTWISDLAYDKSSSSFWLLVGTSSSPNSLVRINAATGLIDREYTMDSVANIVDGSSMAFDGSSFWITSKGFRGGVPVSEIYKLGLSGNYLSTYPCPATTTGYCLGLVWDTTTLSFWAAGSDNRNLVNFHLISGGILSTINTYANLWNSNGVSDIAFDSLANQLLVLKDGMIPVNASTGTAGSRNSFILPGSGRGDWDGSYFWVIDNTEKKLKAVVVK